MLKRIFDTINELMESAGITQNELAYSLGCSQAAVSRLLRGRSKMSLEDLYKIAKILNTEPSVIMERASNHLADISHVEEKIHRYVCKSFLRFTVFNLLREPISLEEIQSRFNENDWPEVRKTLSELKDLDAVTEDLNNKYRLLAERGVATYLRQYDDYNKLIVELYSRQRFKEGWRDGWPESKVKAWKSENKDSLIIDYFTKEQIREQITLLHQFHDVVKAQMRSNRLSNSNTKKEIRALIISHLAFPKERM